MKSEFNGVKRLDLLFGGVIKTDQNGLKRSREKAESVSYELEYDPINADIRRRGTNEGPSKKEELHSKRK